MCRWMINFLKNRYDQLSIKNADLYGLKIIRLPKKLLIFLARHAYYSCGVFD